jgi:trimeric autotransporter adhesin
MAYTKYSLTPANNNAAPPDGAPEGMLPSAVNDTMRDMMAQIRDVGDGIRGGTYTMTAPVITGGSITGVALSGNTLTNPVITGGSINNTPIGATTASTGRFSDLTDTGLTSGRVIYAGTGGNLVDDADFTFNGTTVTMANDASISGLTVGKGLAGGGSNTALGFTALSATTSGTENTGVGSGALQAVTSGSSNTAVGRLPLLSNTTGSSNTAVGTEALRANTTASNNTAVGFQAGFSNTTGTDITAIGWSAGKANTTGLENTSVGAYSLFSNTTANANTAVGRSALELNTTGATNTAIGHSALKANTTADQSTAVGYQALIAATTGGKNTAFGYVCGDTITTGVFNVMLGYNAQASAATNSNELVISASSGIAGKGSSTGYIYPNAGGVFQGNNSATWSITSDSRLKKNIVANTEGLDIISQIQVRNFEYRLPEEITELPQNQAVKKTGIQLGVIAQELQAICPDCVTEQSTGVLSVDTDEIFWHMVNAIKQLKAEIDQLKGN